MSLTCRRPGAFAAIRLLPSHNLFAIEEELCTALASAIVHEPPLEMAWMACQDKVGSVGWSGKLGSSGLQMRFEVFSSQTAEPNSQLSWSCMQPCADQMDQAYCENPHLE